MGKILMKIISDFKDYYDYLAHQYGVDEKIVFNRKPIPNNDETKSILKETLGLVREYKYALDNKLFSIGNEKSSNYRWLSVNGVLYLVYRERLMYANSPYKVFTREQYDVFFPKDIHGFRKKRSYEDLVGNANFVKELTSIHAKLNTPVFWFDHTGFGEMLFIGESNESKYKAPILSELGFASIYPADKLFQDISYFIGNVMRGSPDIKPPVEIENKDKILAHGFDLKQSFRHRK